LADQPVIDAELIAFHLPMHTATRLAAPVIKRVRALNPNARVCAYGLYAPLNEEWLRSLGVNDVLGGEFEEELAVLVNGVSRSACVTSDLKVRGHGTPSVPKLHFIPPDRSGLLPLSRYA